MTINTFLYVPGVCVGGVHWAHGPNDVISADFKDSQFEFQDFCSGIIGFFIQKNMGLETKMLSLSILDAE